jgi:hypothetical protein
MFLRSGCAVDVPLAKAVAAVRDELLEAAACGAGHGVVFAVGPVGMEFEVELRVDAEAKAGFKLWAVGAEVKSGASRGRTHRVSFTLTPKRAGGGDLLVSGSVDGTHGPGDTSDRLPD